MIFFMIMPILIGNYKGNFIQNKTLKVKSFLSAIHNIYFNTYNLLCGDK